jgi:quercetin dioxygenase-like cupin family protein
MTNENYCFCDLAPFYALGLLSQPEKEWVEQQVIAYPELAEELALYTAAMTALPYSVPPLPLAEDLKGRLFDRLELNPPDLEPPEPSPPSFQAVRSQDLNWQPHFTPGVQVAIVYANEVTRELVGFLRAEPGVRYPYHRHVATEELFMLEGDLVIGEEVFGPGDYIFSSADTAHAPYTHGGCKFFFRASMDNEYPSTRSDN